MKYEAFSLADFERLGVCGPGIMRVELFGGSIENSKEGWAKYINLHPDAWTAPVFTAWALHREQQIACPDLVWRIARIACRESRHAALRAYESTLSTETWQAAEQIAIWLADDAVKYCVLCAVDAYGAQIDESSCVAAKDAAVEALEVIAIQPQEYLARAARVRQVQQEIIDMAVAAMQ